MYKNLDADYNLAGYTFICLVTIILVVVTICVGVSYNEWSYKSSARIISADEIRCEIIEFYVVSVGKYNHDMMARVRCIEDKSIVSVRVDNVPVGKRFLIIGKGCWEYRDKLVETRFVFLRYDDE